MDTEYANIYHFLHGQFSFAQTDNGTVLRLIPTIDQSAVIDYTFSIRDGNIVLTDNYGQETEYWGAQGAENIKPRTVIQLDNNGEVLIAQSYPKEILLN